MSPEYRVVCTEQSDPPAYGHGHILAVGVTTDLSKTLADVRKDVATVRREIAYNQASYHTYSPSTGKWARVLPFDCSCGIKTIRSSADAVTDNNLDNLRLCNWQ